MENTDLPKLEFMSDSDYIYLQKKRASTPRFQCITWLLLYKLGSLGSFLSSMVVVKVMGV